MVWERNQELVGKGYGMGEEPGACRKGVWYGRGTKRWEPGDKNQGRGRNREMGARRYEPCEGRGTMGWEPEDMNHVRGEERWDGSQKI